MSENEKTTETETACCTITCDCGDSVCTCTCKDGKCECTCDAGEECCSSSEKGITISCC